MEKISAHVRDEFFESDKDSNLVIKTRDDCEDQSESHADE